MTFKYFYCKPSLKAQGTIAGFWEQHSCKCSKLWAQEECTPAEPPSFPLSRCSQQHLWPVIYSHRVRRRRVPHQVSGLPQETRRDASVSSALSDTAEAKQQSFHCLTFPLAALLLHFLRRAPLSAQSIHLPLFFFIPTHLHPICRSLSALNFFFSRLPSLLSTSTQLPTAWRRSDGVDWTMSAGIQQTMANWEEECAAMRVATLPGLPYYQISVHNFGQQNSYLIITISVVIKEFWVCF